MDVNYEKIKKIKTLYDEIIIDMFNEDKVGEPYKTFNDFKSENEMCSDCKEIFECNELIEELICEYKK